MCEGVSPTFPVAAWLPNLQYNITIQLATTNKYAKFTIYGIDNRLSLSLSLYFIDYRLSLYSQFKIQNDSALKWYISKSKSVTN